MSVCVSVCVYYNVASLYINISQLFGFYDISTFVGYLMPNSFLYK